MAIMAPPLSQSPYLEEHEIYNLIRDLYCLEKHDINNLIREVYRLSQ